MFWVMLTKAKLEQQLILKIDSSEFKWMFFSFFLIGVESDLPEDITEKCVLSFEAAVANHMNIGDAIKKVQNEPLKEIDERFKGQR